MTCFGCLGFTFDGELAFGDVELEFGDGGWGCSLLLELEERSGDILEFASVFAFVIFLVLVVSWE